MNFEMPQGTPATPMPSNRYILPQFEERTPYGFKRQDPYARLFEDRIIFLGTQVDDASADDVMAQLLVLEAMDSDRDITLYINSPGGSFTAMTAIYDTMQFIRPEVQTVALGQAASAAAVLLAAGAPGKRLALPNSRVLIHQHRWVETAVQQPICRFTQTNCFAFVPGWKKRWPTTPIRPQTKFARISTAINSCRPNRPKNTVSSTKCWTLVRRQHSSPEHVARALPWKVGRVCLHKSNTPNDSTQ